MVAAKKVLACDPVTLHYSLYGRLVMRLMNAAERMRHRPIRIVSMSLAFERWFDRVHPLSEVA